MTIKILKNIGLVITTIFVDFSAYAQTTNMQLPQQVGVYNPNIRTQQMRLPQQVGVYAPQSQQNQMIPQQQGYRYNAPVVNYNKAPVINNNLYENVNGYKTPNRYTLSQPEVIKTAYNNKQKTSEDYGPEYYMVLNYGKAFFDGKGLTGSVSVSSPFDTVYNFPLNNIGNSLGDANDLSIGFGVMSNRSFKAEITYNSLSGLKYGDYATATNQWCSDEFADDGSFYYDCSKQLSVDGGKISSFGFNLNMYFTIEDFIGGKILDGLITPYIGGGIGIAFNTIDNYTTYDEIGNGEAPLNSSGEPYISKSTGAAYTESECLDATTDCVDNFGYYDYDGTITHYGATSNNVSWNIEAGLSFALDSKTLIDVYYKHNYYGKVKSKNEVYSSYNSVNILDPVDDSSGGKTCTENAIQAGYLYNESTGWCENDPYSTEATVYNAGESGTIENNTMGVKLRLIF